MLGKFHFWGGDWVARSYVVPNICSCGSSNPFNTGTWCRLRTPNGSSSVGGGGVVGNYTGGSGCGGGSILGLLLVFLLNFAALIMKRYMYYLS